MDSSTSEQTDEESWCPFLDPYGYFRAEIPTSWHIEQSKGTLTHTYKEHVWQGHRIFTHMAPLLTDSNARLMSVVIRVEQFTEVPPPITWDTIEPNSFNALQTYRMTHDSDWLSCTVGHMRLHFQCQTQQVSRAYPPLGWEAPLPLLQDELRRRLMLVQRIFDSLKPLAPA